MIEETKLPTVIEPTSTEVAIPQDLASIAYGFAEKSVSQRTRGQYRKCWAKFEAWCASAGRNPLPAGADTLTAYIAWLASGQGTDRRPAVSSINQAVSALKFWHTEAGHELPVKHAVFRKVWAGARRDLARVKTVRRVNPILSADMSEILDILQTGSSRDIRDAALLSVGWGAARRRSEIVALDWQTLGTGGGVLAIDGNGATVTLMTSKTNQEGAEQYVIARMHAPRLCSCIEAWIEHARIEPGQPVFRAITGKAISPDRLNDRSVPRIVKRRVNLLVKSRNTGRKKMTRQQITDLTAAFSGHSMRAGHVTDAADRGVPVHHIKKSTGHKSDQMISVYSRVQDAVKNSSLKGSGL